MAASIIEPATVFIYGLIDTRTGHLRYVGRTKRKLADRRNAHIQNAKKGAARHSQCWIRGMLMDGFKPAIIMLEQSDADGWVEAEQFWIECFRFMGADLTNIAIGGGGSMGFRHSMETREKWSRERRGENHCWYGVKRPPELHAALNAGKLRYQQTHGHPMLGKKHSAETVEKCRKAAALRGPQTEAARASRQAALVERWEDPAWREKWTARMSGENNPFYGKKWTPEQRAKLDRRGPRNGHFGKKHTEEAKAKIREAALRREAEKRLAERDLFLSRT